MQKLNLSHGGHPPFLGRGEAKFCVILKTAKILASFPGTIQTLFGLLCTLTTAEVFLSSYLDPLCQCHLPPVTYNSLGERRAGDANLPGQSCILLPTCFGDVPDLFSVARAWWNPYIIPLATNQHLKRLLEHLETESAFWQDF